MYGCCSEAKACLLPGQRPSRATVECLLGQLLSATSSPSSSLPVCTMTGTCNWQPSTHAPHCSHSSLPPSHLPLLAASGPAAKDGQAVVATVSSWVQAAAQPAGLTQQTSVPQGEAEDLGIPSCVMSMHWTHTGSPSAALGHMHWAGITCEDATSSAVGRLAWHEDSILTHAFAVAVMACKAFSTAVPGT
jgi:hypothetical protein